MNNIIQILGRPVALLLACLTLGCAKEKALDLSIVDLDPPYTYDDSPLGRRLQSIFDETGTFILYKDITAKDWTWNFDRSSGNLYRANGVEDPATNIPPVLDYFDQYWFRYYSGSFLKNYLPFRIILSDSIVSGSTRYQFFKGEGMQSFSIRLAPKPGTATAVTTRIQDWHDSTKIRVIRELHEQQFLETVGNKLATELPDSFFVWSSYDYAVSVSSTPKNPKELGFWNLAQNSDKTQYISPSRGLDVTDWLKKIISTRPTDMESLFYFSLSGSTVLSEPMKNKYEILTRFLREKYGMDFHDLNDLYF